jgi:hypothetical protein
LTQVHQFVDPWMHRIGPHHRGHARSLPASRPAMSPLVQITGVRRFAPYGPRRRGMLPGEPPRPPDALGFRPPSPQAGG